MMHGRGKSDPVIGAVKPANKAAPTAAELVEQRPGAEGNASQQSTHRVQDRESVSQALERIRHAARQRKEEKVHLARPPHQHRHAADGVLRTKTRRRTRCGRYDVGDLRSGP